MRLHLLSKVFIERKSILSILHWTKNEVFHYSVNVIKSTVPCGFGNILKKHLMKTSGVLLK